MAVSTANASDGITISAPGAKSGVSVSSLSSGSQVAALAFPARLRGSIPVKSVEEDAYNAWKKLSKAERIVQRKICCKLTIPNLPFDVLVVCENGNGASTHVKKGEFFFLGTQEEVDALARAIIEAQGNKNEISCSLECIVLQGQTVGEARPMEELCEGGPWFSDFSPVQNRWEFVFTG